MKIKNFISLIATFLTLGNLDNAYGYLSPTTTPVIKYLQPISVTEMQSGCEGVGCIYIINLDERPEKWNRVLKTFESQNLKVNRVPAINGWKLPQWKRLQMSGGHMVRLSGGEIGCFLSHLSIYKDAINRGWETAWICEDDIEFIESADIIVDMIKELSAIDPEWDIFFTDYCTHGTGSQNPHPGQDYYEVKYARVSPNIVYMHGRHRLHSVIFSKNGLKKVMEYFSHAYLWSPIDVDIHYIPGLREYSAARNIVTSVQEGIISDTEIASGLNPNR